MNAKTTLRALDEARCQAEQERDFDRIRQIDEQVAAILDRDHPLSDIERVDAMHEAAKEAFAIPEDSVI